MGRPPCCDKAGIKKGPWTPEEDIILVSYIQEHGPGNWRSVPINTGLMRCSKSCRLRWTNYLRPGIRRGNFTPHEEGIIIHLQSLLGNRWAAIASYLPQRTDNDIKNYWNTHLKKKLKKYQTMAATTSESSTTCPDRAAASNPFVGMPPHRAPFLAATGDACSSSSYASSTENISKLLQGFMRSVPAAGADVKMPGVHHRGAADAGGAHGDSTAAKEELGPVLSFDCMGSGADATSSSFAAMHPAMADVCEHDEAKQAPFSMIEKWLFDEACTGQVDIMELCSDALF